MKRLMSDSGRGRKELAACSRFRSVALVLVMVCALPLFASLKVGRLTVEGLKNPAGIDVERPMFSWTIEAEGERGVWQTAYDINVYEDAEHQVRLWSSGRVESDRCVDIPYEGAVKGGTRYYWTVTVWDNKGRKASAVEDAWFETGLLGAGWDGAKWIKATRNARGEEVPVVKAYALEADFEIENLAAGFIFGAKDDKNYYMWQVNLEAGYPRFRPHVWKGGNASCVAEIDLRGKVDVKAGKVYHIKIEVDGDVAKTYIDGTLIDTRTNPNGGDYGYGKVGIREDRALNNYNDTERAYFDNFVVTDMTDGKNQTLISEDFSAACPFSTGAIVDGRMGVAATYAWYQGGEKVAYDLELDMLIEKHNAGVIFSATDENNFLMWSVNLLNGSKPILRRHWKANGNFTVNETDLGKFYTKAQLLGVKRKLKIEVRGNLINTYIDGVLVDSYTDTSGMLTKGFFGFRAYLDATQDERACYDNIKITEYASADASAAGKVTFDENFENGNDMFLDGEVAVVDGEHMLRVVSRGGENCLLQTSAYGMPIFRKTFNAAGGVKSAKLYASALGVYDLFVNGRRVGERQTDGSVVYDELKPGWTDYRKEITYRSFDVTDLLLSGKNVVGAQVSNGWWGGAIAHGVYGAPSLGFIAKLVIEHENGQTETFVTDESWVVNYCGPLLYGDIYNGETYDARRDAQWSAPDYDDSRWYAVAENNEFNGVIVAHCGPVVKVRGEELERKPKTITVYEGSKSTGSTYGEINVVESREGEGKIDLKSGRTVIYDLGQNMVGWIKFNAKGKRGTRLTFRFGEMLNSEGDKGRGDDGPKGSLYTYNLRTAKATVQYIMNGDENGETFHPSTTFCGFRYCEVTATDDVEINSLRGEVVGSDIEEVGRFECSHKDVNQLYSNVMWSQRGNFLSIPTDCPQRDERLGWTGDTQIFSRAATYNADTRAFYRKWMRDMRNSQREDGAYPDMAPFCNFWGYGNSAWGDAGVIVPWNVYEMTGDRQVLKENYDSMTKYMNFLAAQSGGGYKYNGAGVSFGDWLAYEEMDARFVSVTYYAYVAQLMSKVAGALSVADGDIYALDRDKYNTLYDNIKAEFQKRYVNANGTLKIATQTSYLLALHFGLMPDNALDKAKNALRKKIVDNGYKLSTGFVGTGILNKTLSELGMDDLAYDLLLQRDNPSWLYSVDQGATTIWERWDSYTIETGFNKHPWNMNSFNHYSYGAVSEWMFGTVCGIASDANCPGFKHFVLAPVPDDRTFLPSGQERITWAKAAHRSGYGLIRSEWVRKSDGRITYEVEVPANTTATLLYPLADGNDIVTEGGKRLEDAEGVKVMGVENGRLVLELQSGSYSFDCELNPDANAIAEVNGTDESATANALASYYTIGGIKLNAPADGINIVRMQDGQVKKIYR